MRLVSMPFKIPAHPEYPPQIFCSHKGGLCDWMLNLFLRILPAWANLEDFNAVPGYPVAEVEFGPYVRRRAMALHELLKVSLAAFPFDIVECHGLPHLENGVTIQIEAINGASPRRVTVQQCRRCAKEACPLYTRYAGQADDKADVVLLNSYKVVTLLAVQ
jgi:hypothetical protein